MIKNKKIKYLLISLLTIGLAVGGAMLVWTNHTYKPSEQLSKLINSEAYVLEGDFYVFEPSGENKETGIVLYPGALVEPLAYSYYAHELSKSGYLVAVPKVNFNLSITDNEKAEEFIKGHQEIENWYVGGHSMGGVSAALYAKNHEEKISGLILLGSYPASSTDLADSSIKVLSLYAEHDGLTSLEEIQKSRQNLPDDTWFIEIAGGNHAQFGMYGEQKGDLKADIDVLTQQNEMVEITLEFLE